MSRHKTEPIEAQHWTSCDGCDKETPRTEISLAFSTNGWSWLTTPTLHLDICPDCTETLTINGQPINDLATAIKVLGEEYFK